MSNNTLRPSPTALLNPRLDPTFKALFTQETKESNAALESFLSSILGRKIRDVKLTSNEPSVETIDLMQMSFDVSVVFDDGEKACIEMQGRSQDYDYGTRSEIQAARLLNNSVKKGSNWDVEKIYQISVLNFHYSQDDRSEMAWYTMKNQNGKELSRHLNIIYIDLLEIKKLVGKPIEELSPLQKWGLYLAYADDSEKLAYIESIAKSEEGIMEAQTIIQHMSEEESNWFRELSYDKARRDYNTLMENAQKRGLEKGMQEGLQQGIKKGIEQGIKQGVKQGIEQGIEQGVQQGIQQGIQQKTTETAINLIKMNILTEEQIAQSLGLSVQDILEIKKNLS